MTQRVVTDLQTTQPLSKNTPIFYSLFCLSSSRVVFRFVTTQVIIELNHLFTQPHCIIVTHLPDFPLIFEEVPLILMIVATHFHSYRLKGCEFSAPHNDWDSFPTLF